MSHDSGKTLEQLLAELRAAVESGDRSRAMAVRQTILRHLMTDPKDAKRIERHVQRLLLELNANEARLQQSAEEEGREASRTFGSGLDEDDGGPAWGTEVGPSSSTAGVDFPVWFGTNRKPLLGGKTFGHERSPEMTLGQVWVHVPKGHQYGEIGSSFWQKLCRFDFTDDALKVVGVERQAADRFYSGLKAIMQAARHAGAKPQAIVFIHGFNVEFDEAAIRAAQIGYDLCIPGATAFFSWPSRGTVRAYPVDEATIEWSEQAIADFLIDFTAKCGAESVHVIAHSMGNRGFLGALRRIAADAQARGKVKFGQIILAAPDVDQDVFRDLAHLYQEHGARATLYCSDGDNAVFASSVLHDAPRAGYFKPYTIADGVDTIAVPDFNVELLGHGYFAAAEPLLYDIGGLIKNDAQPPRQRMDTENDGGKTYWSLRK